ncbi:MAG TPA: methionyl-tRNA formyltransferase [Candidatus Paceibacterota bacterium]|nr:methionyl-tRNA formyltransferase [Candidatus Paceibacterota bacterium]
MKKNNPRPAGGGVNFVFFGTTPLAEGVLAELARAGFEPERIIGSEPITPEFIDELSNGAYDVFVVASFGKILPKRLIELPARGTLNVHPSLLPRLRGPSPMRSAILNDEKHTGISIMLMDEEMDHGPLLAQKKVPIEPWPPRGKELDERLAHEGGKLLAQVMPLWLKKKIQPQEQNHDVATYTKKFTKEDGLLDLDADAYANLLKIRAFESWPGTYAIFERAGKRLRVQILDAHLGHGNLVIDLVKPEGKREMPYADFLRSGAKAI